MIDMRYWDREKASEIVRNTYKVGASENKCKSCRWFQDTRCLYGEESTYCGVIGRFKIVENGCCDEYQKKGIIYDEYGNLVENKFVKCLNTGCEICCGYLARCMAVPKRAPYSNAEQLIREGMSEEEVDKLMNEAQAKEIKAYYEKNEEHLKDLVG